jgi:hypothetical protein
VLHRDDRVDRGGGEREVVDLGLRGAEVIERDGGGRRLDDDADTAAKIPNLELLQQLAESDPERFPRTQNAPPEEKNRALLLDYRDQLASVSNFIDEFSKPEFFRSWISDAFVKHGLVVDRREGRGGAVYAVKHDLAPGVELKVATYIALKKNQFNQVSFVVRHLDDESVRWVVLFARPLQKMYLVRTADIVKRFEHLDPKDRPDNASFTIRKGTSNESLFESRVAELVADLEKMSNAASKAGQ